jgi:K+-sensing histidine kinase KdpD
MVNDVSRWARLSTSNFGRYAMAFAATALALLGRWLLDPFLGNYTPFITLYAAVALSAIYVGFGPALLATVLGLIGADYCTLSPTTWVRALLCVLNDLRELAIMKEEQCWPSGYLALALAVH